MTAELHSMDFARAMYGLQSDYEGPTTRDSYFGRVQNIVPLYENANLYNRGCGSGRNIEDASWGPLSVGLTMDSHVIDFGFMEMAIGPKSGAGTSGDPYVITENDYVGFSSNITPGSIELARVTGSTDRDIYDGCVAAGFTLQGTIGTKISCNTQYVARFASSDNSATNYTEPTNTPFVMLPSAILYFGSTPSAVASFQSFNIAYGNNLIDGGRVWDAASTPSTRRYIIMPQVQGRSWTFSLTCIVSASVLTALRDWVYGDTATPNDGTTPDIPITTEMKISLTAGSRRADIWLDECFGDSMSKPVSMGGGKIMVTVNGTAKKGKDNEPFRWWTT